MSGYVTFSISFDSLQYAWLTYKRSEQEDDKEKNNGNTQEKNGGNAEGIARPVNGRVVKRKKNRLGRKKYAKLRVKSVAHMQLHMSHIPRYWNRNLQEKYFRRPSVLTDWQR